MFHADLPITHTQETVGERRERKAHERFHASCSETSTQAASICSADREEWWTSSLKKAKSVKTTILPRRPFAKKTEHASSKKLDVDFPQELKDPALQPDWTYSGTLAPLLPSGASFDRLDPEPPDLEGDTSSWQTDSIGSQYSYTPWCQDGSPKQEYRPRTTNSLHSVSAASSETHSITRSPFFADHRPLTHTSRSDRKKKAARRSYTSANIRDSLRLDAMKPQNSMPGGQLPDNMPRAPLDSTESDPERALRPMLQPDYHAPRGAPEAEWLPFLSFINQLITTPVEPRFQQYIDQMKSASLGMILDQLKASLQSLTTNITDEGFTLEEQFWLFTSFELHIRGRNGIAPKPACQTGKLLELYGSTAEVYQWSALHPSQTIYFLTTKLQRSTPLPSNVSYLTTPEMGSVPLPYPENYFSHIRASTLPSLVPSAGLPKLFGECYKLLASGGLLEIRMMDAIPVHTTTGPLMRAWMEDRLCVNLERLFRCSKPCLLIPIWLKDVNFELSDQQAGQLITLPCAIDPSLSDVDQEFSMTTARCLWKSIWGSFVDEAADEPKWWWEKEEIVQECVERRTVIQCQALFAYKQ